MHREAVEEAAEPHGADELDYGESSLSSPSLGIPLHPPLASPPHPPLASLSAFSLGLPLLTLPWPPSPPSLGLPLLTLPWPPSPPSLGLPLRTLPAGALGFMRGKQSLDRRMFAFMADSPIRDPPCSAAPLPWPLRATWHHLSIALMPLAPFVLLSYVAPTAPSP